MIGIRMGIAAQARRGEVSPITATITPSLGALSDGDTIASGMSAGYDQASNYSSTAGTISTVVAAATVNGVSAAFGDTVAAGDVVVVTVTVTDSAANERAFNAGTQTVADVAPVATGGIADQSFTEDVAITPLDVSADFTGSNLTFALAPSSAALPAGLSLSSAGVISGTPTTVAGQVNIVVRATNSAGTADTAFGVTIVEAGGATFPSTLFAANEPGFVVDASDLSSLWQDTGATTAVAANGDPVALTQDLSTSTAGVDHQTSVSGNRPLYQTDGTLHWLLADGVDDELDSPVNLDLSGADVFTAVFALRSLDTTGGVNVFWQTGSNKIFYAPRSSTIHARALVNGGNVRTVDQTNAAFAPPADMVMRVEADLTADTLKMWINGTLVGTSTGLGAAANWGSAISELFTGFANIRLYAGFVIGRALTAGEITDADQWGADRAGVTL